MTISVGSKLPAAPESLWEDAQGKPVTIPTEGKVLLIGVPGAFTPPCSDHVPGYIQKYDALVAKGVKEIYIVAVNDIFVVKAWKTKLGESSKVHFLADSTGEYTKSLGLDFDASGLLGNTRSKRYAAVVEDGVVKNLYVESDAPNLTVSTADSVLAAL